MTGFACRLRAWPDKTFFRHERSELTRFAPLARNSIYPFCNATENLLYTHISHTVFAVQIFRCVAAYIDRTRTPSFVVVWKTTKQVLCRVKVAERAQGCGKVTEGKLQRVALPHRQLLPTLQIHPQYFTNTTSAFHLTTKSGPKRPQQVPRKRWANCVMTHYICHKANNVRRQPRCQAEGWPTPPSARSHAVTRTAVAAEEKSPISTLVSVSRPCSVDAPQPRLRNA